MPDEPTDATDPATALSQLLDAGARAGTGTVEGFTNHLPMALVAKAGLGADADELRRFAAAYAPRIVAPPPVRSVLGPDDWTDALGRRAAGGDLLAYFEGAVDRQGVDGAVTAHLPHLLAGCAGGAFHGVIRLAYAREVASPARVAAGLAAWAEVARPLAPGGPSAPVTDDPLVLLDRLRRDGTWSARAPGAGISGRMAAVAADPRFTGIAGALAVDDGTPARLARAALVLYASTDDFTALHGVTGLAAIDDLRPLVAADRRRDLSTYAFQALAAAYLTVGAPPLWSTDRLDAFVGAGLPAVADVQAVAARTDDEHVAKVVWTAHRRFATTGDPLYRAVAARAAGVAA
jgi:hypothetical protein